MTVRVPQLTARNRHRPLVRRGRSTRQLVTDAVTDMWLDGVEDVDTHELAMPDGWLARDDGWEYAPNPGQAEFHNSPARFRVLFGGRGSGKSAAGAQEALHKKIRFGLSGAVINPDFENFKYSTWPEFKRWVPWDHVIENDRRMAEYGWEPRGNFVIHFKNGAVVYCKGLRDPDAARGPNLNWLWYDEGGRDRTGMAWKLAIAGIRIGPNPRAWVTTTPRGRSHWTWQEFGEENIDDEVIELMAELGMVQGEGFHSYHHASIHDNRANLDPGFYVSMLTSYSGPFADQELRGQVIEMVEGLVYANFTTDNITAEAEYDPARGAVEIAYDDGFGASPRVFLFIQVSDDGVVNIFDELYHHQHQGSTCVGEAKDRLLSYCRKHYDGRDPDGEVVYGSRYIFERLSSGQHKVAPAWIEIAVGDPAAAQLKGAFKSGDIVARVPGTTQQRNVLEGIKLVYNLIARDDGTIGTRIHPRCRNFIREISEGYRYPEGGGGDGVKPIDEDDHGPDAFRYWAVVRRRRG